MDVAQYLQLHIGLTITLAAIIGLVVGSFLNLVISRYPKMLKQKCKAKCQELLKQPATKKPTIFNLIKPRPHCVKCQKQLKPSHKIPLFSYLFLRGKCAYCNANISPLYPSVEILTAILSVIVVSRFGFSWITLAVLIFVWSLIALSFIDFREKVFPNTIVIPMLWLGLLANSFWFFTTPANAILAAFAGYSLLWVIARLYKLIQKKGGMHHGDFIIFAMVGAWLGIDMLLNVLLTAIVFALIIKIALLASKKFSKKHSISFGLCIALGGGLTMIFGPTILNLIARMIA